MISASVDTGAEGTAGGETLRLLVVWLMWVFRCSRRTCEPDSPDLRVRRRLLRAELVVHLGLCP